MPPAGRSCSKEKSLPPSAPSPPRSLARSLSLFLPPPRAVAASGGAAARRANEGVRQRAAPSARRCCSGPRGASPGWARPPLAPRRPVAARPERAAAAAAAPRRSGRCCATCPVLPASLPPPPARRGSRGHGALIHGAPRRPPRRGERGAAAAPARGVKPRPLLRSPGLARPARECGPCREPPRLAHRGKR